MNTIEFLSYIRSLNIRLYVDGARLRCQAPQGAITPSLKAELAERKSEIIAFLNQAKTNSAQTIQPISRDRNLPVSFAQQRLWFLDKLEGQSAIYNISKVLRLSGKLNLTALEQAFQVIVERHETLRTSFQVVNDSPVQIIAPQISFTLPVIDLQNLPIEEQSTQVQKLVKKEAQKPFNLTQAPLLRVTLLHLKEQSHILVLTIHHIISDGWSMGIFIRELSTLYQAFHKGEPNPLPPLSIQYADFSHWQREWLQGEVLSKQLNYWKAQLTDAPRLLELPTDHPRPPVQTFRGRRQQFQLNAELTRKLKTLSQQSEATLFMTLLAAFVTLLYRYTSQADIVIGSPIANRNRSQIEPLIGFFVNTLALRINLDNNPKFNELLAKVQQIALDAYAHQDLPFEKLIEELQPERSLSYSPLFQVMFVLQNAPSSNLELPDLTLTPLELDTETAKFDLTLSITETEQGLRGVLEYATDLFDEETITRMAGHFQTLLEGIIANPQQKVSQFPILTEAEQHQLLVEWNNTQTDYPKDKSIHQLFEEQVDKTPDAVAVVLDNQKLTYQELNNRANQLAHYLQRMGVKTDVLVGICVERSLEMIVGLLAILKAGGAYVPLDPTYPSERLTYMLEDAQVRVLLTQHRLVEGLPTNDAKVLCLDTDWRIIAQESQNNLLTSVSPDNLAYINYTSGSTGKPKGVAVVHHGVIRLLFGIDYVHLDAAQRLLQMAPISFDAATFEIWGALLHGARCVFFPERVPTADNLRHTIETQRITTLWLTSALFNSIIDDDPEALSGIQQLLTGGESLSIAHVQKALKALPSTQIINGYGPTESTTFACCYCIPRHLKGTAQSISIGRPISNTQVYVLDSHFQPVPIGVPGELHIGGDGLAKGYLNRLELTAEKFVPNPFSNEPDARLYKTGDIARYLPDGNIEFIGRIDHQVKIRGFRIELGEIEAVLSQHRQVKEVVVIAREDQPGNQRLVAYFVSNSQQVITDELRSFLKQKLPEYMMPSAFVRLDTLPLTPNGKVDRRALPKPEIEDTLSTNFVPPRTSTEEQLASIWASVLGIERVGIHDNFFELGGHSLLATQVISRIRQAFEVELQLRSLFEAPTVDQLSDRIETILWATSTQVPSTETDLEEGEL
ncbi:MULTISPECIES: non-ribosomal peptide synthetase [unclassified Coleofasciculus]|uniref:non-ribosomal peptide synthetase n=1 Tax=unclassified Coleofasciculus TaxID=2692782 RepID=UPI00187E1D7C|nr:MULTISPECIES: non-ribosomal peptide synthetase [unclassified Coleofasciculus]MBE9125473.1 amino acid adenylation domain-containing protein [Coleofasciculus sp. LEGE 07081]MBE9147444.1 amino acid adenylation domain-containing protein [Coleofasciculus sp. LEGE 07092]